MEPKSELLVFKKKEIVVIIALFVLVALFSFTLGLRLGKTLGAPKAVESDHAPLTSHSEGEEHGSDGHSAESASAHGGVHDKGHDGEHSAAGNHAAETEADDDSDAEHKPKDKVPALSEKAQDLVDQQLEHETKAAKNDGHPKVAMSFPADKKAASRFTLQVGSHKTVAEAADQVAAIKKTGLDAFYLEAKVPGKGTWYRVGIGLFETKEVAERTALKWKQTKTLPPYIVQKVNE